MRKTKESILVYRFQVVGCEKTVHRNPLYFTIPAHKLDPSELRSHISCWMELECEIRNNKKKHQQDQLFGGQSD